MFEHETQLTNLTSKSIRFGQPSLPVLAPNESKTVNPNKILKLKRNWNSDVFWGDSPTQIKISANAIMHCVLITIREKDNSGDDLLWVEGKPEHQIKDLFLRLNFNYTREMRKDEWANRESYLISSDKSIIHDIRKEEATLGEQQLAQNAAGTSNRDEVTGDQRLKTIGDSNDKTGRDETIGDSTIDHNLKKVDDSKDKTGRKTESVSSKGEKSG